LNDEPFDSTFLRNRSFEFKLGANEVVAGLDIAVSTMKKKEKAQFIFDCEYYCGITFERKKNFFPIYLIKNF